MENTINQILTYLQEQRGFDFTGNRLLMIQRRISKRFSLTHTKNLKEYFKYILKNNAELDKLINVLTINVSSFFRDILVFKHLDLILNELVLKKQNTKDNSIRIWSAGCATGEEPYSVAIFLNEILQKSGFNPDTYIFASDIDTKTLKNGEKGIYSL